MDVDTLPILWAGDTLCSGNDRSSYNVQAFWLVEHRHSPLH